MMENPDLKWYKFKYCRFRIDRGTGPDVCLLFDESWLHIMIRYLKLTKLVLLFLKDENGAINGIFTNSIATGGGDLYL